MNGKRAKALRKLSLQSGIGYESMKNIYNRLGRESEQENKKRYEYFNNTPKQEQAATSSSDSKEMAE